MKTWRERIVAARERGKFTEEEMGLSRSWCTCAVGEQHARGVVRLNIDEHDGWKFPRPDGLETPGYDFQYAVEDNDFNAAERLLDAIEDRALQLKREATP